MRLPTPKSAVRLRSGAVGKTGESQGDHSRTRGTRSQSSRAERENARPGKIMSGRRDLQSLRKWAKICGCILAVLMLRVWENVQSERLERGLIKKRLEADRLTYENGRLQM